MKIETLKERVSNITDPRRQYGNIRHQLEDIIVIGEDYFQEFAAECTNAVTSEKGHGRIEIREYFLSTDIEWLEQRDDWTNLNALGMVRSKVIDGENESEFTRYFITSLTDINGFAYAVRKHWSIEYQLHWCIDVILKEDSAILKATRNPLLRST